LEITFDLYYLLPEEDPPDDRPDDPDDPDDPEENEPLDPEPEDPPPLYDEEDLLLL
jgi:hypothetical protein